MERKASTPRRMLALAATAASLCLSVACGSADEVAVRSLGEERVVPDDGTPLGATDRERFALGGMGLPGAAAAGAPVPSGPLAYELPAGWVEAPTTSMRKANFLVAGDARAECYFTELAGDAGGLDSNVNRWRKQMSLAPASSAEIAALPRHALFGRMATFLDIEGSYVGMGDAPATGGYRMLGLLAVDPQGSAFLKLFGPKEVVDGEVAAFLALARSLGLAGAAPTAHGAAPAPADGAESAAGLKWETPPGWRRAADRPFRAVSFTVAGDERAECYVSVLTGDGGGALANVNRWRAQLGATPLSDAELADLPSLPLLGDGALLVEAAGHFTGMSGETQEDALLLGAIRIGQDASVFVKLIGPRDVLESERAAFLAFCRSLTPVEGS